MPTRKGRRRPAWQVLLAGLIRAGAILYQTGSWGKQCLLCYVTYVVVPVLTGRTFAAKSQQR